MQRRQFVTTATASIAAASIAGCSGILGGDGGGNSGPESAVHAYADAINDNDPEAFEAAIHPDSPQQGASASESELEPISMSVKSTKVTDGPEDGVAVVEAELETTFTMMGEEQTETQTLTFEVRKHEGDWKLYQEV
jgi:hypothetical protein